MRGAACSSCSLVFAAASLINQKHRGAHSQMTQMPPVQVAGFSPRDQYWAIQEPWKGWMFGGYRTIFRFSFHCYSTPTI
jgi:hypothetical protein